MKNFGQQKGSTLFSIYITGKFGYNPITIGLKKNITFLGKYCFYEYKKLLIKRIGF